MHGLTTIELLNAARAATATPLPAPVACPPTAIDETLTTQLYGGVTYISILRARQRLSM